MIVFTRELRLPALNVSSFAAAAFINEMNIVVSIRTKKLFQ